MNAFVLDPPTATFTPHRLPKKTTPTPMHSKDESNRVEKMRSDRTKTIIAHINVGWGNSVYLRGEGGGLKWDIGVPMLCIGEDRWVWSCHADEAPKQFKFLRDDRDWAVGENELMPEAEIAVYNPVFPE
jgi:hypothetical protein